MFDEEFKRALQFLNDFNPVCPICHSTKWNAIVGRTNIAFYDMKENRYLPAIAICCSCCNFISQHGCKSWFSDTCEESQQEILPTGSKPEDA